MPFNEEAKPNQTKTFSSFIGHSPESISNSWVGVEAETI